MKNKIKIKYEDLIGTFEQKKALVSQFNLIDDTFFSVVMENKAACEYFLEKIFGRPLHIIDSKTQYSIRNIEDHSVTLDLYAVDEENKVYNIEIHTGDDGENIIKRVRYHQAAIDWSNLEKGKDYRELPDTYIIFITREDIFKLNRNKYEIIKIIKDTDEIYDNGAHLLFFNTTVDDNTELSEFLHYIEKSNTDNEKFGALSKAVKYHKINEKGVDSMCKAVEDFAKEQMAKSRLEGIEEGIQKGIEKGIKKGRLEGIAEGTIRGKIEAIRNMLSRGIDLTEALALTGLDRKTYEEFSSN